MATFTKERDKVSVNYDFMTYYENKYTIKLTF